MTSFIEFYRILPKFRISGAYTKILGKHIRRVRCFFKCPRYNYPKSIFDFVITDIMAAAICVQNAIFGQKTHGFERVLETRVTYSHLF